MTKLKVEKLCKVFGDHPQKALKMLEQGYSKDEIFALFPHRTVLDKVAYGL